MKKLLFTSLFALSCFFTQPLTAGTPPSLAVCQLSGDEEELTLAEVTQLLEQAAAEWSYTVGELLDFYDSGELTITSLGEGWFEISLDGGGNVLEVVQDNL